MSGMLCYRCKTCRSTFIAYDLPIYDEYGNLTLPKMRALSVDCQRCNDKMWIQPYKPLVNLQHVGISLKGG